MSGWVERARAALSRVRVRLAVSFALAGVVNLVLLALLALTVADLILGRGTTHLVESQIETYRRLASASASDLADELAWQAVHGRPSPAAVRDRTGALHGLFPESAAEVRCGGDDGPSEVEEVLGDAPWISGDDFVSYVGFPDEVALIAFARRSYGDCWANVAVRRNVDEALAERIQDAIGLDVRSAGPQAVPADGPVRAFELLEEGGSALGGNWWPVITVARDATTGEPVEWLALQVRPDPATVTAQLSRVGQRPAGWVWLVSMLTAAVVLLGASSMALGARISNRIGAAIQDLSEGAGRFGAGELEHRIPERGGGELGSLAASVNNMAADLERLIEEAKAAERLEEEIRLAREVQEWIYPREAPRVEGAELAVECLPARVVTGDVYDVFRANERSLGVLCADVSGKGVAAALLGASLHAVVRENIAAACRGGSDADFAFPAPSAVMEHASEELRQRVRAGQYATAFWFDFDARKGVLRYCNAGHLPPILVDAEGGELTRLAAGGVPIGLLPESRYEEGAVEVAPGSLLISYSDGITEAENAAGEDFGDERLVELIRAECGLTPSGIAQAIMAAAQGWQGDQEQMDDMTVIVLRAG